MIFKIVDKNLKVLSCVECEWLTGIDSIIEIYKSKFNLDIGSYGLGEWELKNDVFSLIIRDEDLINLRNDKLSKLLF